MTNGCQDDFLNGNLDEIIYMVQPEWFIAKGQEEKVCKLQKSIYELKQASRSWNIKFDQSIKSFDFDQYPDEPCVYKRYNGHVVVFLVIYVDDILLIGNDIGTLSSVKVWLPIQFNMKDLGEASHILGIKLMRDARSLENNVGLIPSYLYRSDSCQIQHAGFQEGICSFQSWNISIR